MKLVFRFRFQRMVVLLMFFIATSLFAFTEYHGGTDRAEVFVPFDKGKGIQTARKGGLPGLMLVDVLCRLTADFSTWDAGGFVCI